jgi:hypothetical protein
MTALLVVMFMDFSASSGLLRNRSMTWEHRLVYRCVTKAEPF